jgi:hypothetical protein
MSFSNCTLSGFEIIRLVSSANRIGVVKFDIVFGKSFMCIKKKRGPNIDPCRTPSVNSFYPER